MFLDLARQYATFWALAPGKTLQERCDGVAYSLLGVLDGDVTGLPPLDLVTRPFAGDAQQRIADGKNYFESGMVINDDCMLHDLYYKA